MPCRILEYLSRDDAERAVKDLDGKELRGRTVRVALDEAVNSFFAPQPYLTISLAWWARQLSPRW